MQLSRMLIDILRQLTANSDILTPTGKEAMQGFFDQVERTLSPGEHVMELTYADAMKYFKIHAPKHQKATQGLIMREITSQEIYIIQIFLDAKDEIIPQVNNTERPYGRRLFADRLDQELDEAFGRSTLILVK